MKEAKMPMNLDGQIRLRNATDSDVPFIFNSWLKNFRTSPTTLGIASPVFYQQHHKVLEGLCKRASLTVACNNTDIGQIYGYLCCEKVEDTLVIHFIYVKETFRRLGVARMLLEAQGWGPKMPIFYTHKTRMTIALSDKFPIVYNPYLMHYAYPLATETVAAVPDNGGTGA